jgi:cell division inhibitor SulA
MGTVVALSNLLEARQVWRGRALPPAEGGQPTGWPLLDAALPTSGWPEASLTEILLPADGIGELRLVLPTLARLTQGQRPVVLIAPPYAPCAMGWRQQGVNLQRVDIVDADEKQVLWAAEQCLRSGSCAAVLTWPQQADDRSLRRLQVAADTGRALAFVFRDRRHLANASPAALRLELAASPQPALWIRKCRGGNVPVHPLSFEENAIDLSFFARSYLHPCEEQLPPLLAGEGWGGVGHLPKTSPQEFTPSQPPPASRGRSLLGALAEEEGRR